MIKENIFIEAPLIFKFFTFVYLTYLNFECVSDGFRKVVHIDSGIVKQERDGPVEF